MSTASTLGGLETLLMNKHHRGWDLGLDSSGFVS